MFLIKSQLDNVNTTLRLHHYDNRHKHEWLLNKTIDHTRVIQLNFWFHSLLRRVKTNKCHIHLRVWGHMVGGLTLK